MVKFHILVTVKTTAIKTWKTHYHLEEDKCVSAIKKYLDGASLYPDFPVPSHNVCMQLRKRTDNRPL